ncbi:MAG: hypothetical protein AB8B91_13965 [Rubripirellula sp.]
MIANWIMGAIVGTFLIGITSPWTVRSYVPLNADAVRGVWTLPPNQTYRWRSEGYANTSIGPLGMPGKTEIKPRVSTTRRVALWGDSQAEGVCVPDHQKIFAQAESLTRNIEVFPLARSGEDIADWLTQIPAIERELEIDAHVFLIVDLADLFTAGEAPLPPPSQADVSQANSAIAAKLPAFFIQAARHLLTDSDGSTRRQLRFSTGPVTTSADSSPAKRTAEISWLEALRPLQTISERPRFILYAPKVPQIVNGKKVMDDPTDADFLSMKTVAEKLGITVLDARPELLQSATEGAWPHGFHNGRIGSGHLNEHGNRIVAWQIAKAILPQQASELGN